MEESIPETRATDIDFRAPPPSPVAPGRRSSSSFANEDILTEFLEHSLQVPDLVLPNKIFPKDQILETPPVVDYLLLKYGHNDDFPLIDSAARLGCFQLVNHGVPCHSIRSAMEMADGLIFQVPIEKRAGVTLSPENPFGFEEANDEEEESRDSNTLSEEFVWCKDESFKLAMEGILPSSYSNFSEKMEALMSNVETLGERIVKVVKQSTEETLLVNGDQGRGGGVSAGGCYVRRHRRDVPAERWERALRYDVIKMLIRGTDYSHALCFHICDGSNSEFHVYSKKGWISFSPEKGALVVTIGDQIQAVSGGQFKHVLGRPIFKSDEDHQNKNNCNNISMAFLYSPPPAATDGHRSSSHSNQAEEGNYTIITIRQQALVAFVLPLVFQFLAYIYNIF